MCIRIDLYKTLYSVSFLCAFHGGEIARGQNFNSYTTKQKNITGIIEVSGGFSDDRKMNNQLFFRSLFFFLMLANLGKSRLQISEFFKFPSLRL